MPKLSDDEIEEMLTRRNHLHLATITDDGSPWMVPIGFTFRDRTIYLTARAKVRWLANIRRDPRVAVSIDDFDYARKKLSIRTNAVVRFEPGEDDQWRDLRLPLRNPNWTGATQLEDGSEEWNWAEAYTEMTWDEPRALVAIPLEGAKVTSWRMPYVGEYLDEVWAPSYFHEAPKRFKVSEIGETSDRWRVVREA